MKNLILIASLIVPSFGLSQSATLESHSDLMVAQNRKGRSVAQRRTRSNSVSEFRQALQLSRQRKYAEASEILFRLVYNPRFRSQAPRIRYILGLNLWKMKMYQLSAFQFISVVKEGNGKYVNLALEKLSVVADILGDDSLLNYAISRVQVKRFPSSQRDMLYFRIGEFQQRGGQYLSAASSFSRVRPTNPLYAKAKYNQGLSYALAGKEREALNAFDQLAIRRESAGPNDTVRAGALMGKARVYYQMKDWDRAIETYRQVPRDSSFWHDTLFESSWAMMRSGRFRSALSNFQSLHSAYYEGYYLPESLLLRSIVYLYICKFDEVEKVLDLFSKLYKPVYARVDRMLDYKGSPEIYFNLMVQVMNKREKGEVSDTSPMPYVVAQKISQEGDFQNSYNYIRKLLEERRIYNAQPASWRAGNIGRYSKKVLETRIKKAKAKAGRQVRYHLLSIKQELVDLFEQEGFIRFEALNSQKEELKKEISGKDLKPKQVDEERARDFYIKDGYQYWPFDGEYWLDEIGNYHYVGTQSCR